MGEYKGTPDRPVPAREEGDDTPQAAAWLRDVADGIASYCGDNVLRHLLEEEWRHAAERARPDQPMPIADLEALLIFIAERIRRDHGLEVLIRLLGDARILGETRETMDNHPAH